MFANKRTKQTKNFANKCSPEKRSVMINHAPPNKMISWIALILWIIIGFMNLLALKKDSKENPRFKYYFWQYWFAWFAALIFVIGDLNL